MKKILIIKILILSSLFAYSQNWIKNGDFNKEVDSLTPSCVFKTNDFYSIGSFRSFYYGKDTTWYPTLLNQFNCKSNAKCNFIKFSNCITDSYYAAYSPFFGESGLPTTEPLVMRQYGLRFKKKITKGLKFKFDISMFVVNYFYSINQDTTTIYPEIIYPKFIFSKNKYIVKYRKAEIKPHILNTNTNHIYDSIFYLETPNLTFIRPKLTTNKNKCIIFSTIIKSSEEINYLSIGNFFDDQDELHNYLNFIHPQKYNRELFFIDYIRIKPVLDLGNDTTICPNQTFTIRTLLGDSENLVWNDGSKADSLVIHQPGKYWVTWTHEDGISTDTIIVGDKSQNLAPFPELPNQKTICAGQSYFYSIPDTNQFKTYLGKFLQKEAINLTQSGFYKITLKNQCEIVKDYPFTLTDSLCDLFIDIPNAITPNGDGLNDVFSPIIRSNLNYHYKLSIFNRWGQSLFTGQNQGWNSLDSNGKTYPMDAYLYVIEVYIQDDPSPKVVKTGTVTILK